VIDVINGVQRVDPCGGRGFQLGALQGAFVLGQAISIAPMMEGTG